LFHAPLAKAVKYGGGVEFETTSQGSKHGGVQLGKMLGTNLAIMWCKE
jgi:hypothetical protein